MLTKILSLARSLRNNIILVLVGYSKHTDDIPACRLALMIGSDPGNVRAYDDATTRGEVSCL